MGQVSTREVLQSLANQPLGSQKLQEAQTRRGPNAKPLPEVVEVGKRCAKIWLPEGKERPTRADAIAAKASLVERQTDIEDAVEAAGGSRGKISER